MNNTYISDLASRLSERPFSLERLLRGRQGEIHPVVSRRSAAETRDLYNVGSVSEVQDIATMDFAQRFCLPKAPRNCVELATVGRLLEPVALEENFLVECLGLCSLHWIIRLGPCALQDGSRALPGS